MFKLFSRYGHDRGNCINICIKLIIYCVCFTVDNVAIFNLDSSNFNLYIYIKRRLLTYYTTIVETMGILKLRILRLLSSSSLIFVQFSMYINFWYSTRTFFLKTLFYFISLLSFLLPVLIKSKCYPSRIVNCFLKQGVLEILKEIQFQIF